MRALIIGATGNVGRALASTLSSTGVDVIAASRHRVGLDAMERELGCRTVLLDLRDGADLPAADVAVDLTWVNRRTTRAGVHDAAGTVATLDRWLEEEAARRVVHAGTIVVTGGATPPAGLVTRLTLTDSYAATKSATERAIARSASVARYDVVRLGAVVCAGSQWETLLLNIVSQRAVANPEALAGPAGLCSVAALAEAVDRGHGGVRFAPAFAGFTWGEVIAELHSLLGEGCQAPVGRPPGSAARGSARPSAAVAAGLLLPSLVERVSPSSLGPLLRHARTIVGRSSPPSVPSAPGLPILPAVPGAQRDERALGHALAAVADRYLASGWDDR